VWVLYPANPQTPLTTAVRLCVHHIVRSAALITPRRYDLFLTRESDAKMAKLNKKTFDEVLDANTKQEPWERVRWLIFPPF